MKDLTFMKRMATAWLVALMMMGAVSVQAGKIQLPTSKDDDPRKRGACLNASYPLLALKVINDCQEGVCTDLEIISIDFNGESMPLNPTEYNNSVIGQSQLQWFYYQYEMDDWNNMLEYEDGYFSISLSVQITYRTLGNDGVWSSASLNSIGLHWAEYECFRSGDSTEDSDDTPEDDGRGTNLRTTNTSSTPALTAQPNPTNGDVTIKYHLEGESEVSMSLHDATGRKVRDILLGETRDAGSWLEQMSLEGDRPGMYYILFQSGEERQIVKVLKL